MGVAVLAALVLVAAYAALAGWAVVGLAAAAGRHDPLPVGPWMTTLMVGNAVLLGWRLAMRAVFVGRVHGARQGLLSVPRVFVANIIAMMAARRALAHYLHIARGRPAVWEKTDHVFPVGAAGR